MNTWGRRRRTRAGIGRVGALAGLLGLAATLIAAPPALAEEYQLVGRWAADQKTEQIAAGEIAKSEWRFNVNDTAPAAANAPVDNVTITVTAGHAEITRVPDICLTSGVDPVSTISPDKSVLTCNVGTQKEGTAIALDLPVLASGRTGDQVELTGAVNGQSVELAPIPIVSPFKLDMKWDQPSSWIRDEGYGHRMINFPFSLWLGKGSDSGPDSITYRVQTSLQNDKGQIAGVECTPHNQQGTTVGYPYSSADGTFAYSGAPIPAHRLAPEFGQCDVTDLGSGLYEVTVSGIDYSLAQVPTQSTNGTALPRDRSAIGAAALVFEMKYTASGSLQLEADAPSYGSVLNPAETVVDETPNNSASRTYTLPGSWSSAWLRNYTKDGGSSYDDSYRLTRGTVARSSNLSQLHKGANVTPTTQLSQCNVLDTKYVDYVSTEAQLTADGQTIPFVPGDGNDFQLEYYTGNAAALDPSSASYQPDINCGELDEAGWSASKPANPASVGAVRLSYPASAVPGGTDSVYLFTQQRIQDDAPLGQDIYQFGWRKTGTAAWTTGSIDVTNIAAAEIAGVMTDPRYPTARSGRDVLRVIDARPVVSKSVTPNVAKPDEVVTYSVNYSAQMSGKGDPVKNFTVVDTLPAGIAYVPGSSSAGEPAISGQVLTWTFNDVEINRDYPLTYQGRVLGSVKPGQVLTNQAVASYSGVSSEPAKANVTVSTNGVTTIGKQAQQTRIPNLQGDGSGSGGWEISLRSQDPVSQSFTDVIDILPWVGDKRGTAFSGSYAIDAVNVSAGETVYYTTAAPAGLSDDPADPSNGSAGDVAGNTVSWTTDKPADASKITAIRVIGGKLMPAETRTFEVLFTTEGAKPGDLYVNRAQGRAEHTELVMRTSDRTEMSHKYSADLKKFVKDPITGDWLDANVAEQFPTYKVGDEVPYRIVVTNTGTGTLTNLVIHDDRFEAVNATIAQLESGKEFVHEYTGTAPLSQQPFVNTASASVDTPPGEDTPPLIPSDPAGIQTTDYLVTKSSDPVSGSDVSKGDVINYTVEVKGLPGSAAAQAVLTDDLSDVLDDATYNGDVVATAGTAAIAGPLLSWSGDVAEGETVKITYSVTVTGAGDTRLRNVVSSPGCEGDCSTTHQLGRFTYEKTSDPASGSRVSDGDRVTYTLTVRQHGAGVVKDASVTDDLSGVLSAASWNNDARATSGAVERVGEELRWSGDLAQGDTVTITYSVRVAGDPGDTLRNLVSSADPRGACNDEVGCETSHDITALAITGAGSATLIAVAALALVGLGAASIWLSRRRRTVQLND